MKEGDPLVNCLLDNLTGRKADSPWGLGAWGLELGGGGKA